ncbi:hypothetical protein [Microvirga arsenatis]|uniref:DUF3467 domain-containing protein n=1 Tax=Microvirga arsenatis TaxID=2692265 RepID=A0ABW9YXT6_9HYPH|nr:hypothetical protein [Microvirga arsenatis]NBJ13230.1 hypothetical protein [Microvirga arsenatis]NBJ25132.1 hypothetical protein [Microvirga arsenatis]
MSLAQSTDRIANSTQEGSRIGDAFWIEWALFRNAARPNDEIRMLTVRAGTISGPILVRAPVTPELAQDLLQFAKRLAAAERLVLERPEVAQ